MHGKCFCANTIRSSGLRCSVTSTRLSYAELAEVRLLR